MKIQRKENSQTQETPTEPLTELEESKPQAQTESPEQSQSQTQKKESAVNQNSAPKNEKAGKEKISLHEFVEKRLWGQPVSLQDGFMLFYSRNADKYKKDLEQALIDFTRQR